MHTNNETLSVAWCDNGMVDGLFAQNLFSTIVTCGIKVDLVTRVFGNQIGRQRQTVFDFWDKNTKSDWLLWVDSDVVINAEAFKKLWETADKLHKPVVSGVYFISKESETALLNPMAAIYMDTESEFVIECVHPLPENKVIKIDYSGFGFILMHRSIIEPLKKISENYSIFAEKEYLGDKYLSEDISFCRNLKKANIPLHAHTGALVQHIKRFSLDINYYNLYWNQKHG